MATTTTLTGIGLLACMLWEESRSGKMANKKKTETHRIRSLLMKSPGHLIYLICLICWLQANENLYHRWQAQNLDCCARHSCARRIAGGNVHENYGIESLTDFSLV